MARYGCISTSSGTGLSTNMRDRIIVPCLHHELATIARMAIMVSLVPLWRIMAIIGVIRAIYGLESGLLSTLLTVPDRARTCLIIRPD